MRGRGSPASGRGSSPLARGLRSRPDSLLPSRGIIPARAGFTAGPADPDPRQRDHPRSRGVYTTTPPPPPCAAGSSPLARGLPGLRPITLHAAVDHPRSRGVYAGRWPRLTGVRWIIPARAGFTPPRTSPRPPTTDHPRSRGVYDDSPVRARGAQGSSPLARGLPADGAVLPDVARIIPARAGFTDGALLHGRSGGDHPRSRGVYRLVVMRSGRLGGSSPLARGLRQR